MSAETPSRSKRAQTPLEERINASTHGLGALVSLAAGLFLFILASQQQDLWKGLSVAIYSITLVLMYLSSTLYHRAPQGPRKAQLRLFDHCAIYLLIAGSYTPFLLIAMRTPKGWLLLALVWAIAVSGIVLKLRFPQRFHRVHVVSYVLMGWIAAIVTPDLMERLPESSFSLIVAGGIAYTIGAVFYAFSRVPYFHSVWHVFVMAGSACHYLAVYNNVIP